MSDRERKHIADLLGKVVVAVRMGEITHAQIDERLNYIQFLLDNPGYYASEATLMKGAAGG